MTDLSTIYDIMKTANKFPLPRLNGDFGVEIETEVETSKRYEYPKLRYWTAKKDGSLRDYGVEYVLNSPLSRNELKVALEEFDACNKKFKFRKDSISTSVHVHVNMLNDTYLTLANFIAAYALTENNLIKFSGPDRLSNLFCLPFCDAEGGVAQIVQLLQAINKRSWNRVQLNPERTKYASLNLATLSAIGTAEIRCFRGETDTAIIDQWVGLIDNLKKFAQRKDMTPIKVLDIYRVHGPITLLDTIYGEFSYLLKGDRKEAEELIKKNLKFAADFACVTKDWSKFGIYKVKPVYKEKIKDALDKMSIDKFGAPFDNLPFHERLVINEMYHKMNTTVRVVDIMENI